MSERFEDQLRRQLEYEAGEIRSFPHELRQRIRTGIGPQVRNRLSQQLALTGAFVIFVGVLAYGVSQVRTQKSSQPLASAGPTLVAPSAAPTSVSPQPTPGYYSCQNRSGGGTVITSLSDARVGNNEAQGYDRIVFQFSSTILPNYTIVRQDNPTFTESPSDMKVTLEGSSGAVVSFRDSVDGHSAFQGSRDQHPRFAVVKEFKIIEDFEGHLQWAVGLAKPSCIHVSELQNPTRLVIDFQAP